MSGPELVPWVYLAIAIVATAAGQLFYKLYFTRKRLVNLVISMCSFCIAPPLSYLALKVLPLGLFYMSSALSIVLVVFASVIMLGERLSRNHLAAMSLIVAGIVIYGR